MRLLLCEDERELSKALVAILTYNHYSVDAVYDGEDALDYLRNEIYDGVILDIMMPKVDGITVLKTIRAAGNGVPVLMLTAKAQIDDKVAGLDCGADDYLTKPFDTKELLARVRALTRRRTQSLNLDLSFGNIRLDRSSFELIGENKSARLGNKEFQMLEMLLTHPNHLVSTDVFMEKIWGYDSDAEINVVWTFLSYLRKKLKQVEANVVIKSNRSLGYSLEVVDD